MKAIKLKDHPCINDILIIVIAFTIFSCTTSTKTEQSMQTKPDYTLVIHGGAGTITRSGMTSEMEAEYLEALNSALDAGEGILRNGGTSLDAVQQAILIMEDSPLFNAGKGAVFTHDGKNELDAAIMDGKSQKAGAVAGVRTIKNPIMAARAVMENTEHVLLSGTGAEEFAGTQGLRIVDPSYFYTENRWQSLQKALEKENQQRSLSEQEKHGTVGAVALDRHGNLAAGTSTGGMTNKRYGRIGDTPLIGAGTYADNASCAVSCTGHGEFFIRYAVAHDVSAAMLHGNMSVIDAAHSVIHERLPAKGGSGGLIAVDAMGNIAMEFNTEGMYRGYVKPGEREVKIYGD
jgi:beta-aspartyl-peptidase (threonine type)